MKQKNIFILFVLLATMPVNAFCQSKSLLSKFYFSMDIVPLNMRWFDNKITKPNEFTVPSLRHPLDTWNGFPISIGYKINKKANVEVGYFNMAYYNGVKYSIPTCSYSDFKNNQKQEEANHFFAKFYYAPFQFNIFNDPLKFYLGLGYAYARSSSDGFGEFAAIIPCDDNQKVLTVSSKESTTDLAKDFHLLIGDLKIAYEFSDYMSVTASVGFGQGFKTLGIYKMKYELTGEPIRYSESTTKGSNLYLSVGFHISPFANFKKRN